MWGFVPYSYTPTQQRNLSLSLSYTFSQWTDLYIEKHKCATQYSPATLHVSLKLWFFFFFFLPSCFIALQLNVVWILLKQQPCDSSTSFEMLVPEQWLLTPHSRLLLHAWFMNAITKQGYTLRAIFSELNACNEDSIENCVYR